MAIKLEIKVTLKFDKVQSIDFINMVLENTGAKDMLSSDASELEIVDAIKSLHPLKFNSSDFINKKHSQSFYMLGVNLMHNETKQKEPYKSARIRSIDYNSDNDIIVRLWDENPNKNEFSWAHVAYNIECRECIIDELFIENESWFEFIWFEGTHILNKENNNFHYDYYSAENYDKLIEQGIHPDHFGSNRLFALGTDLHNLKIEIEDAKDSHYDYLHDKINQKQREIEEMEKKLSKILEITNNNIPKTEEEIIDE